MKDNNNNRSIVSIRMEGVNVVINMKTVVYLYKTYINVNIMFFL